MEEFVENKEILDKELGRLYCLKTLKESILIIKI